MGFHPDIHLRRSMRLKAYDYAQAGAYFVTVCAQGRECVFGEVVDGEMRLNEAGRVVVDEWSKTTTIRNEMELDAFVVMPNHIHGMFDRIRYRIHGSHVRPVVWGKTDT